MQSRRLENEPRRYSGSEPICLPGQEPERIEGFKSEAEAAHRIKNESIASLYEKRASAAICFDLTATKLHGIDSLPIDYRFAR